MNIETEQPEYRYHAFQRQFSQESKDWIESIKRERQMLEKNINNFLHQFRQDSGLNPVIVITDTDTLAGKIQQVSITLTL